MTTQTTTIRTNSNNMRALIGAAAAGLAVLGGALLWQARPASEPTAPAVTTTVSHTSEGVAPMGGLAERYRDERRAAATAAEARATTAGGMAELYAQQASDRFAAEAARTRDLGGVGAPSRASDPSTCGTVADGAPC